MKKGRHQLMRLKWGFAVIEQSLWQAVPRFFRQLDEQFSQFSKADRLPLDLAPIRFATWMGGDRDGNPNVTHKVTKEVTLLARWMAADLYIKDLNVLRSEFSMTRNATPHYASVLVTVRNLIAKCCDT